MYPALEDGRIPEGIKPISVVRARQSPNGSRSGTLALQAWRANAGEGNPLACAYGNLRGPKPYVKGWRFFHRSAGFVLISRLRET